MEIPIEYQDSSGDLDKSKVDVDDWPLFLGVGDRVWYRGKQWIIKDKLMSRWGSDCSTFVLACSDEEIQI